MTEAERTNQVPMTCVCRLAVVIERNGQVIVQGHDSCSLRTSGPDEPVCGPCVEANHPRQSNFDPIIKTPRKETE